MADITVEGLREFLDELSRVSDDPSSSVMKN